MIIHMKRTTIMLDEGLFKELRHCAAKEGKTLTQTIDLYLREGFRKSPKKGFKLVWRVENSSMDSLPDFSSRDRLYDWLGEKL